MRFILSVFLTFLLFSLPSFGQTEKPQTIIVPTGSLGEISKTRIKILEKTLESKLDDYFDIVPKDLFEEAQEKAFEELEYEECTEEQCIMMIKEMLQVENSFQLVLISEEGDTQISLTWNDLDKKRVEEEYCEGCKTKQLRSMVVGLVESLLKEIIEVEKQISEETNLIKNESNNLDKIFKKKKIIQGDKSEILSNEKMGFFSLLTDEGRIFRSKTGVNWKEISYNLNKNNLKKVIYGNNIYLVIGENGSILHSRNGYSWTAQKIQIEITDVLFYDNKFFVVGSSGSVLRSKDGLKWENVSYGDFNLNKILNLNDHYIALGNNGNILISKNSIDWEIIKLKENLNLINISYGNGLYVSIDRSGNIIHSKNLKDWKTIENKFRFKFNNIIFFNGLFIIICNDGRIIFSEDGITWEIKYIGITYHINSITKTRNNLLATGNNGLIIQSNDGIIWEQLEKFTSLNLNEIKFNDNLNVLSALGDGKVFESKDGIKWNPLNIGRNEKINDYLILNNSTSISISNKGKIFWSNDRNKWIPSFGDSFNIKLFESNNKFYFLNSRQQISSSNNAINWDYIYDFSPEIKNINSEFNRTFTGESKTPHINSIILNNNTYTVVGNLGLIFNSNDMINWDRVKFNSNNLNKIFFHNGVYYILGTSGTLTYSKDRKKWESIDLSTNENLIDIVKGRKHIVCIDDDGGIIISQNGKKWEYLDYSDKLAWGLDVNDIIYDSNVYIIVGDQGFSMYSNNAKIWNYNKISNGININNISYGNGNFVAVGDKGTLFTSKDGIKWETNSLKIREDLVNIIFSN